MNRLYIVTPISITDEQGRSVREVAIYDDSLLSDYLIGVTLKGAPVKDLALAKKSIYLFLEHWENGERNITIKIGDFNITTYSTSYIDVSMETIFLGEKPENPERDVRYAIEKAGRAMLVKSPKAASAYQELQDILKKYPTLPIKEQA